LRGLYPATQTLSRYRCYQQRHWSHSPLPDVAKAQQRDLGNLCAPRLTRSGLALSFTYNSIGGSLHLNANHYFGLRSVKQRGRRLTAWSRMQIDDSVYVVFGAKLDHPVQMFEPRLLNDPWVVIVFKMSIIDLSRSVRADFKAYRYADTV
jgi:hypothetical protein